MGRAVIVAKKDAAPRAARGGEAASLTLISVRRPRQATQTPLNPTDLSVQLQPAAVMPEPAPVAAAPLAPLPAAAVPPRAVSDRPRPAPSLVPEAPAPAPVPEAPMASPTAVDQWARLFARAPEAPPSASTPETPPAPVASPFGLGDSTARPEPLKPPPVEIPTPQPTATLVARAGAAITTAELPKPAPAPVEAPPAYDDLPTREALIDYWDELRGNADQPQIATLDRRRVAVSWSDSLMVSYQSGDATLPQMTRFGRLTGDVQYTSMVTEWILSCSRKVSRIGSAMETEQNFPSDRGNRTYRMLLLPFASAPAGSSDHVLCNLSFVR